MFNFSDDAIWLNVTNIALGVVALICCAIVFRVFAREAIAHFRETRTAVPINEHEMFVYDLGLTMADGGERIDKEPNIILLEQSQSKEQTKQETKKT